MNDGGNQVLGEFLFCEGLLTASELTAVIANSPAAQPALLAKFAAWSGREFLADVPSSLPAEVVDALPARLARIHGVVPWRTHPRHLDVLTVDPFNEQAADDLAFVLEREVRLVVADPEQVEALLRQHYPEDNRAARREPATAAPSGGELSAAELAAMAAEEPVIDFVNLVLTQAVDERASDVHFEPFEHEFKVRRRIDGVLHAMPPPPRHLGLAVISRLKVLANLNIAERRRPQDGRLRLSLAGRAVDLRVSTLPTQFGESVVLRVLDQAAVQLDLAQLGMPADVLAGVGDVLRRPNGIFLVTGPTGSGKTTTLYSGLRAINSPELRLLTIEDPVEYEIDGIMQVPVNPEAGLTFASALRSFLRQDPDIIMVGEIRDLETAQIAIQASLTGHLVLSTLHTNDAAGAITRLVDMGVEPFLIASSLEGVLAQRLVRRICPQCRTAAEPPPELLAACALGSNDVGASLAGSRVFHHGRGCEYCNHTGYRGRLGIFEWLPVTEAIRDLIGKKAAAPAIREQAVAGGMRPLRDEGLQAALDGHTTLEEVVKYT